MDEMAELEKKIKEKKAEVIVMERMIAAQNCIRVLKLFYDLGFKEYVGFKTICQYYDSSIEEKQLVNFWNLRNFSFELASKLESIYERLKKS